LQFGYDPVELDTATVDQTEIRRSGRHDIEDDSDLVPDF
jgi:hypothetical protein